MISKRANIIRSLRNMTGRYFPEIWQDPDREDAFKLCNRIRQHIGVPQYSRAKFEEGVQYRNIFHPNLRIAKDEFINLVFGWW